MLLKIRHSQDRQVLCKFLQAAVSIIRLESWPAFPFLICILVWNHKTYCINSLKKFHPVTILFLFPILSPHHIHSEFSSCSIVSKLHNLFLASAAGIRLSPTTYSLYVTYSFLSDNHSKSFNFPITHLTTAVKLWSCLLSFTRD